MDDKRLENIINMVRSLNLKEEIANSVGGGGIAGSSSRSTTCRFKEEKEKTTNHCQRINAWCKKEMEW